MSERLTIRDARHWRTGERVDLAIADGTIAEVRPHAARAAFGAAREIDAAGAVIAPGLVDAHVHLREPGQSAKETLATGARAAAAGGFTSVLCMPNTSPVVDTPEWVDWVLARSRALPCRIHPIAAVTLGQQGERLADLLTMAEAGAVAFSDDGRPVRSAAMMRRALEYARPTGRPIIDHAEDADLRADGQMHEGSTSTRLGVRGMAAASEAIAVRRDIELAELTGGRLHIAHVSCAASIEALRDARRRGLDVTSETCPHYWTLTDEAVAELGTAAKMNPPLRSERDRRAVLEAIQDGTIDLLATDHAPHTAEEKQQPFEHAPFGIVGLETALALTITHLVEPGHLELARALELWTTAPRRRFGLPAVSVEAGDPADLVLIDPGAAWTVDGDRFFSKGRSTPFAGWPLRGRARLTLCAGAITHEDLGVEVSA